MVGCLYTPQCKTVVEAYDVVSWFGPIMIVILGVSLSFVFLALDGEVVNVPVDLCSLVWNILVRFKVDMTAQIL